jgi:hypothetical protein
LRVESATAHLIVRPGAEPKLTKILAGPWGREAEVSPLSLSPRGSVTANQQSYRQRT